MSYLNLAAGIPNFSKAVISLWFWVPKESVIAASSSVLDSGMPNFFMLQGILLLASFGQPQSRKVYQTPTHNIGVVHPNPINPLEPAPGTTYNAIYYQQEGSYQVDPSFIGLQCQSDGTSRLVFNLQLAGSMVIRASSFETTKMDIYSGSDPGAPVAAADVLGSGVIGIFPNVGVATIRDVSHVDANQPECFLVETDVDLAPDQWHHLLLSFDVSGTVRIGTPFASSECRLWYAIDDMDYRGAENLQPYRDTGGQWGHDNLDPNAIVTQNAYRHSGGDPGWEAINYYQNHYVGLPSGSFGGSSIPSDEVELGLPASTRYMDAVFNVMMAELQVFTGLTIDTGDVVPGRPEVFRRAFVDDKGFPVRPAVAEEMLGQRPEILLHGTGNWQAGKNTGSLGTERDNVGNEVVIPAGQFEHIGRIDPFKPDPSLQPPAPVSLRRTARPGPVRLTRKADARL